MRLNSNFQSQLDFPCAPTTSLTHQRLLSLQLETCLMSYTLRNPGPGKKEDNKEAKKEDKKEAKKKKKD